MLAVTEDGHGPLQLLDSSGQPLRTLNSAPAHLDFLAFSPDGRLIISARRDRIRLWRTSSAGDSVWREFPVHGDGVYAVALTADGRTLVSAGRDNSIRLWELATGTLRRSVSGHTGAVLSLAVSPDGRTLASAGEDGKVLLHDLAARGEAKTLTNRDHLWEQLALHDAAETEPAAQALRSSPQQGVELLAAHLRPIAKLDEKQIEQLIVELNAPRFAIRKQANKRLEALGNSATPALRRKLTETPALELRRRIEMLLAAMEDLPLSPDELRVDRAIELLEQLATPDARRLLDQLARGASGARQTDSARAAMRRLSH